MAQRPKLAAAIVLLSLGAGIFSLVALRWIGFMGIPPVFFLTFLLVGMPVGGLVLVGFRRVKALSLSSIALISAGLALASAALFLVVLQWANADIDMSRDFADLIWSILVSFLSITEKIINGAQFLKILEICVMSFYRRKKTICRLIKQNRLFVPPLVVLLKIKSAVQIQRYRVQPVIFGGFV